jgi:hypothetical protein
MRRILFMLLPVGMLACGGGGSNSGGTGGGNTQPAATAPTIALAPGTQTFSVTAGAASPAAKSVAISNSGSGTLSGLAAGTIAYGSGQMAGWLAVSLSATTSPATLTLTPTTGTLVAGTYTATIPITSSAASVTNTPQSIGVTLTVTAGPATHLAFGVQPSSTNGGTITPAVTVAIEDALGDVITTANTAVTLAIGANGAGATLSGTTTVAAVAGVATFSNLSVSPAGTGFTLVASATGLTGATSTPFSVTAIVASLTLGAAGQSSAFLSSPNFSSNLAVQAGSQYLIAVVNTDASSATLEGFSLTGNFSSTSSSLRPSQQPRELRAATNARAATPVTYQYSGPPLPSRAMLRSAAQNHLAMLEQNRLIFARLGNPSASWANMRAQSGRSAPVSAAITATIGAVSKVYVKHSLSGSCTAVDSIGARTVAIGQHVIVLADTNSTAWPQAFRPDSSFYQTFANEYDQVTWPHLLANIGNPLGYDASLSSVGKVTVTLTPVLNNFAGPSGGGVVVAFVNGCDFFPLASSGVNADFSNQTEMFYSLVPSANSYTIAGWEAELRATAAHESKHIVSIADRILNNSPTLTDEVWLEEGLAQESSEIWERNFNQATWKGQATFTQTVVCEFDFGSGAPCDHPATKPSALTGSHLPFLFDYLLTESSSNSEGLGLDTPANYGAGWAISRWATDQYASAEGTFIKSLINEPTLTGLNNLAAHTGQSIPLLLTYWNVASAIFQTPTYTAADVRTTIPSFNFADIFKTAQTTAFTCGGTPCGLFTTSGTPAYPIQPIAVSTSTAFSKTVNGVPGTSASFFLLTGPAAGIEVLQLLTPGGIALSPSSGFRVAILRVQ